MDGLGKLVALTGIGTVGYRAYTGQWPWEAEWWPGGLPFPNENVDFAVDKLSVEHKKEESTAVVEVENHGSEEGSKSVAVSVSGEELASGVISIKPGERRNFEVDFEPKSRPQVVCGYIKG